MSQLQFFEAYLIKSKIPKSDFADLLNLVRV